MSLRTPLLSTTLLVGVLAVAWWLGREPQPGDTRSMAPAQAARGAEPGGPRAPLRSGRAADWGPSPFGDGPVVVALEAEAAPAAPSRFATQVHRFELLRSRAVIQTSRRAELAHLARALQADLPRQLSAGDVSASEALLLTGALLEILEPDAQLRAAEMAQFSVQFLPPVSDESS